MAAAVDAGPLGRGLAAAILALLLAGTNGAAAQPGLPGSGVEYVIHISVDGLRPDAVTRHRPDELPNFYRLRAEGAFTDNARTDVDYSITLPNHVAQLTGRAVMGAEGHGWTSNSTPAPDQTLHDHRGAYLPSVFDVAHDNGARTGAYVSKAKFVLFERSYDAEHGAPDLTGADDGRGKIDAFVYEKDTERLIDRFVRDMAADPFGYAFIHLRDPDSKGHAWGWRLWKWHPYMASVRKMDRLLGEVLHLIDRDPRLAGRTALIVTADHGGSGHSHDHRNPVHYTVPFYVWGPGIPAENLYALNDGILADPHGDHPGFDAFRQPVRNGNAANLALAMLGLGPVPGSTIDAAARMRAWLPPEVPDALVQLESPPAGPWVEFARSR